MSRITIVEDGFYSIRQVADYIGVSTDTVRRAINAGELVAHKFRGQVRIKGSDFLDWEGRSIL